jgi:phage terminase large subunit GpA-like protein
MAGIHEQSANWLRGKISEMTDEIPHYTPVEFNEKHRYLNKGETIMPGYLSFDPTPYWIKPLNQLDPYDPTREIYIMKGVKMSYNTTLIEGGIFYFAAHLRSFPAGFVTADKEMAQARVERNIIPMFQQSGFGKIFRSIDENAPGKTGKTRTLLQFEGGGSLQIEGAKNADKWRMYLWLWEFLDEIDTYPDIIGKDGDPMEVVFSRCKANWSFRKITGGSTPLIKGHSHIEKHYKRGNQQVYKCRCMSCGHPMPLRWFHDDLNKSGVVRGMKWDYQEGTNLHIPESVRYECWNCGHEHYEHHKPVFINKNNSFWEATAEPIERHVESYHMPATLSAFIDWTDLVTMWHRAFLPNGKVRSDSAMMTFYNHVLGATYEVIGKGIPEKAAYSHRRDFYHSEQILNEEIDKYDESGVLFLVMTVDVQKHFLSVAVWGVTVSNSVWLIEYKKLDDKSEDGCLNFDSPAWGELRRMIDENIWTAVDDGKMYRPAITMIDCSWGDSEAVVTDFCSEWAHGVYPLKGDAHSYKRITSFYEYKTAAKMKAFMVAVDHYKDRLAPVLRRRWVPEDGNQPKYHFNAPVDIKDSQLKELTVEFKRPKKDKNGDQSTEWYRPPGTRNELWDLLVYCHAAIDILARLTCIGDLELPETDWFAFWEYAQHGAFFTKTE